MPISKSQLAGNKLVVKHRSKKEQTDMAKHTMRQATREATPKAFKMMNEKAKKKSSKRRSSISKSR